MKIFDENGRHIGDLKEDNQWTPSGCLMAFLGTIALILLSLIVAYFSEWWGNIGYWVGFALAFAIYSVVFFYVYNKEELLVDTGDYFKAVVFWILFSIVVVIAFDFITSMVTGQDCYIIFGGLQEEGL